MGIPLSGTMDGLWFHGIHKYILEKEKRSRGGMETEVVNLKAECVIELNISETTARR